VDKRAKFSNLASASTDGGRPIHATKFFQHLEGRIDGRALDQRVFIDFFWNWWIMRRIRILALAHGVDANVSKQVTAPVTRLILQAAAERPFFRECCNKTTW